MLKTDPIEHNLTGMQTYSNYKRTARSHMTARLSVFDNCNDINFPCTPGRSVVSVRRSANTCGFSVEWHVTIPSTRFHVAQHQGVSYPLILSDYHVCYPLHRLHRIYCGRTERIHLYFGRTVFIRIKIKSGRLKSVRKNPDYNF